MCIFHSLNVQSSARTFRNELFVRDMRDAVHGNFIPYPQSSAVRRLDEVHT